MARLARSLRGKGEKMYNILVCDDEKDIVSALEIYLTADGYQVFTAYLTAIRYLRHTTEGKP